MVGEAGPQTLAIIADVHGNRWALEAVLDDMAQRDIDQIVNLGDSLTGPLDPAGTANLLMRPDMPSVCGNDDRVLLTPSLESLSKTQRATLGQLTPAQLAWLREMPDTLVVASEVFACHGDLFDAPYLLEQVDASGVHLRRTQDIETSVADLAAPVILCAHSHVPRVVSLSRGQLIVNPGSVGLPAYTMDDPLPYAMESGSPHARYAVLQQRRSSWQVELIHVPYAWDEAAQVAAAHGRSDWAQWLRSGRAQ
jgi:predicted phosphodiesterase